MTDLSYRSIVSIVTIVIYTPPFLIGILLSSRHGFKALSWRLLFVVCLCRLLGSAFQLTAATIPGQSSLLIGYYVTLNVSISALELSALALLNRVVSSIKHNAGGFIMIDETKIRYAQLFNTVGLINGFVGGIITAENYSNTGQFKVHACTEVGLAFYLASFAMILFAVVILAKQIDHAEKGEKRVLFAIAASLPFILIRLIYSSVNTYGGNRDFSPLFGNVTILLIMGILAEWVVVMMYVGVGLTLKKEGLQRQYQDSRTLHRARPAKGNATLEQRLWNLRKSRGL